MTAGSHYDRLELRSLDERAHDLARDLPALIARARDLASGYAGMLADIDPAEFTSVDDLARLPVLRKAELARLQSEAPPFGGFAALGTAEFEHLFQSPGPIYEPGMTGGDWWRMGRFLHACGIGPGDIVQNCLSYHLTPAGMIFESGARAVGATVIPAGTGQTDLQVRAAAHFSATAYAGTPDYLKTILETADEMGVGLDCLKIAAVGGGALFPATRQFYADRGISCLQSYATADLGSIAYETVPDQGLVIDEGVVVEIVVPGAGEPVEEGRIGEVVVTTLNQDYPLIRFATGDLSAFLPGTSSCGRTNRRLAGWKGRADQTTKIRGMFVRPDQVAELVRRSPGIIRVRIVVSRANDQDVMTVLAETETGDAPGFEERVASILKLRGVVEFREKGSLPDDGKVIDDQRVYD